MALFMVANNLTPDDVLDPERELAFPESVVEFFEGELGQPPGGFPEELQQRVLQGPQAAAPTAPARRCRRPTSTPPATRLEKTAAAARPNDRDVRSATCIYPRCSPTSRRTSGSTRDTSVLPTPVFFYGLEPGEEVERRDRARARR